MDPGEPTAQVALVAIGLRGRPTLMGYRGDRVHYAFDTTEIRRSAKDIPKQPGFYVWTGTIQLEDGYCWDYEAVATGTWAPATPEQVVDLLGVTEPQLPTYPAGDTIGDHEPYAVLTLPCTNQQVLESYVQVTDVSEDLAGRDMVTFNCPSCGGSHKSLRLG